VGEESDHSFIMNALANFSTSHKSRRVSRARIISALGLATLLVAAPGAAQAVQPVVDLGAGESFAVLAGSGITNTGPTTVSGTAGGDMGSHPTGTFTGEADVTTTGTKYLAAETAVENAKTDLVTAYDDAAGRIPATTITGDLGGQTLVAGVYNSGSSIGLTGTVTLDAENDPSAVFIFQAGSTLTTAASSTVVLLNGAQACNVFWQVGSSATFGTDSAFAGNVLAFTSITATTRATFNGQLLARNGAVTLDTNTIVNDTCVVEATPEPAPEPTPVPTPEPMPEAPVPAPDSGTVDGGELPNTGGIEWLIALAVGVLVIGLGVADILRSSRRP
jgi:hypothetical protein